MTNGDSKNHQNSEEDNLDGQDQKETPQVEPASARQPQLVTIPDVELERLKKEAVEYKDKYLRALAEAENARKRLQKERQELTQYAMQGLIIDFLNPIDHMENALKFTHQMSEEIKHWALGFQMILNQFKDVLDTNGVKAFNSVGTPFDPHLHEAVEMVPTDAYPPGIIVEESLRGYKMGDRVIRPSRVKVAKSIASEEKIEQINEKK